jgi:hypothetical protein
MSTHHIKVFDSAAEKLSEDAKALCDSLRKLLVNSVVAEAQLVVAVRCAGLIGTAVILGADAIADALRDSKGVP